MKTEDYYQELFDYMNDEIGVVLLQTEMDEILRICGNINTKTETQNLEHQRDEALRKCKALEDKNDKLYNELIDCSTANIDFQSENKELEDENKNFKLIFYKKLSVKLDKVLKGEMDLIEYSKHIDEKVKLLNTK